MTDFDDQARAASERLRQQATELAGAVDRDARVGDQTGKSPRRRSTARWLVAACAVAAVTAGVIGWLVIDREPSSVIIDDDSSPPTPFDSATPTSESAPTTATAQASTSTLATAQASTPTTAAEPAPVSEPPDTTASSPLDADLIRPVVDPTVCESFSAIDGALAGLPLNPGNLPLTLFGRPSSLPIPIQIIGDPIDGPTKPFALIERSYDSETAPSGEESIDVNGVAVWFSTLPGDSSEAVWTLPDGSQGFLRSRGLDRDRVVAILAALSPRPPDSAIPGFDYGAGGPPGLELVIEQLSTDVTIGARAGSQCRVAATGSVYRIWAVSGGPLYQFASVIDRPAPFDVGIIDGTVIVISGPAHPTAPTVRDVVDADEDTWVDLLARPADQLVSVPTVQPIGGGVDVVVELVPIDPNQPTSSLTLRLSEREGVPFLQYDRTNAVIAEGAQYFKTEIDGRLRLRNTAHPYGVAGTRLADSLLTTEFTVNISTTDGDDFTIQTTGDITLQPQP